MLRCPPTFRIHKLILSHLLIYLGWSAPSPCKANFYQQRWNIHLIVMEIEFKITDKLTASVHKLRHWSYTRKKCHLLWLRLSQSHGSQFFRIACFLDVFLVFDSQRKRFLLGNNKKPVDLRRTSNFDRLFGTESRGSTNVFGLSRFSVRTLLENDLVRREVT